MKFICPEIQKGPFLKWGKIDSALRSGVSADCSEEGVSAACSEAGDCSFCAQQETLQQRITATQAAALQVEPRQIEPSAAPNLCRNPVITEL